MSRRIKVEHDADADALYVRLGDAPFDRTEDLGDGRRVDYAADGSPIGVEILAPSDGVDVAGLPEAGAIAAALRAKGIAVWSADELRARRAAQLAADAEWRRTGLARAVARAVTEYRRRHGLSIRALAEKLGMQHPAVARLESGEHNPSIETLERLSGALGLRFVVDVRPGRPPGAAPAGLARPPVVEAAGTASGGQLVVAASDEPVNVWDECAAIWARTERESAESVHHWQRGIDRLVRGLDPIRGYEWRDPDVESVLVAVLGHAVNTQYTAYYDAVSGFGRPALALVRRCFEDWLAYWYVRNNPSQARRFLVLDEQTPEFNEMVQALEKVDRPQSEVREIRKWFNKLSHVDRIAVRLMWGTPDASLALGPTYDAELFDDIAAEFAGLLPMLIEAAESLCRLLGRQPTEPGAAHAYHAEIQPWLDKLSSRSQETPVTVTTREGAAGGP